MDSKAWMELVRKPYPSDVSDEEWSLIVPYLTLQREDAGQREHSLREVFNGLRYIVKTGAPWRWMPNDLPPWAAVYQQTQRWLAAGVNGHRRFRKSGFSRNFGADHAMIRARSSSRPARPYIERFMSLSLLILPSTGPVLQGNVNAARTASMSRRRPRANELIALSSASVSHGSSALISRPTRILWNRRVRSAACAISGDAARTASTNRASSPWRVSLGAVRSRAACRDDGGLQRRSAPDRAAGCAWPSRNRTLIQRRKLRTSPT